MRKLSFLSLQNSTQFLDDLVNKNLKFWKTLKSNTMSICLKRVKNNENFKHWDRLKMNENFKKNVLSNQQSIHLLKNQMFKLQISFWKRKNESNDLRKLLWMKLLILNLNLVHNETLLVLEKQRENIIRLKDNNFKSI